MFRLYNNVCCVWGLIAGKCLESLSDSILKENIPTADNIRNDDSGEEVTKTNESCQESKSCSNVDSLETRIEADSNRIASPVSFVTEQHKISCNSILSEEKCDTGFPVWNRTPSCLKLQTHVLQHSQEQKNVGFDVDAVLRGSRGTEESNKGMIEVASEEFLQAAMNGKIKVVRDMLENNRVNVDVADCRGHTALIGAAVS